MHKEKKLKLMTQLHSVSFFFCFTMKVLSHFSQGADEDFILANYDVTFSRYMCQDGSSCLYFCNIGCERGKGLVWHLKRMTVREVPANAKEQLFLAPTCSETEQNIHR